METAIITLGAVCVLECAVIFTLARILSTCIREQVKLTRAFARTKNPQAFIEPREKDTNAKHVSLSVKQVEQMKGSEY